MNLQPPGRDPEGRPRALIHHAAVPLRLSPFPLPRPFYPNGVHAVRRQQLARIGRGEVRRGHPNRLAPSRPTLDRPRDAVRPPQPAPGEVQLPVRNGGTDQRRGDRLAVFADRVHHAPRACARRTISASTAWWPRCTPSKVPTVTTAPRALIPPPRRAA